MTVTMNAVSIGLCAILMAMVSVLIQFEEKAPPKVYILMKTLCSCLFVAIGLISAGTGWTGFKLIMIIGLILGLLGDFFLALPEKFFLPGLLAFLSGHVCYIAAFVGRTGWSVWPVVAALLLGTAIAAAGHFLGAKAEKMTIPALVYIFTISFMVAMAHRQGSLIVGIGSILFAVSDSVLAYNMFVKKTEYQSSLVLGTYYGAQALIALSLAFL